MDSLITDIDAQPALAALALANIALMRCKEVVDLADLERLIPSLRETVAARPERNVLRAEALDQLIVALLTRFHYDPQSEDMPEIIVHQADMISLAQGGVQVDSLYRSELDGNRAYEIDDSPEGIIRAIHTSCDLERLKDAVSMQEAALLLWPQGHCGRHRSLVGLADALTLRFNHAKNEEDLVKSISLLREAHNLEYNHVFLFLASLLSRCNLTRDARFLTEVVIIYPHAKDRDAESVGNWKSGRDVHTSRDLSALNDSISLFKRAVRGLSFQHSDRPSALIDLANALVDRYTLVGNPHDLDEAISIGHSLLDPRPTCNHYQSRALNCLQFALRHRFQRFGDVNDIDEAILLLNKVMERIPDRHETKLLCLDNLSQSFAKRFERLRQLPDIDQSISKAELALNLTPDGAGRPRRLTALGLALAERYTSTRQAADIEKAIVIGKEAVKLTPHDDPDKLELCTELGSIFSSYFGCLSGPTQVIHISELDECISNLQLIIDRSGADHSYIYRARGRIGSMLICRFDHLGEIPDINRAIQLLEDVHTIEDELEKLNWLLGLSRALAARFIHLGNIGDIDRSISLLESAVAGLQYTLPGDHPCMVELGAELALRCQLIRGSDRTDIDRAIDIQRGVVEATRPGHPNEADRLAAVGVSLLLRFVEMKSDISEHVDEDVDEAVAAFETVLQKISDDDRMKPDILCNLESALETRCDFRDLPPDFDKWISLLHEADYLYARGTLIKSGHLKQLGDVHRRRSEHLNNLSDVAEAIALYKESMRLTFPDHRDYPDIQFNLGRALCIPLKLFNSESLLEEAIIHLSGAALSTNGPSNIHFQAATQWARRAWAYDHRSVFDACAAVVDILPRLAWLGLPIPDRHRELVRAGNAVNAAAAVCIEHGDYTKAVEWLEQGRSIVWGQLLQLKSSPLDVLHKDYPALANRLAHVSAKLEASGLGMGGTSSEQSARHRKLISEREDIVRQIRAIPKFKTFMQPKTLKEIMNTQISGHVIVLNISSFRCDALILTSQPSPVQHVPLPNFSHDDAQTLQNSLYDLIRSNGRQIRGLRPSMSRETRDTNSDFESILSKLWSHVVEPILNAIGLQEPEELPRLWWCPTGPVAFLPIHAAGLYNKTEAGFKLSDFAVSSYIPTLGVLFKDLPKQPRSALKLLAIAHPSASLPGTLDEIRRIESRAIAKNIDTRSLVDGQATVQEVMQEMKQAQWVHFACHGLQNMSSPTESSLSLAGDAPLKLSEIIGMSLSHPELAFLSACQTAKGHEVLSEEAVHLAAGMLLAGYKGVIATMWSIMDNDAPQVADDFYGHLFGAEKADYTNAAYALHYAVEKLRIRNGTKSFLSWVPFIHIGV
ncbi:CHAT domain-containing protein [Mycena epipterygia]|nr:CHAT domain-containing protein [Mycena epipterygia]